MDKIVFRLVLIAWTIGAAAMYGEDPSLASLARPPRNSSRPGTARSYTNEDLRRAAGRMTFSRPANSTADPSPPAPPALRPATRRARTARPARPAPGPSQPASLTRRTGLPVESGQDQPAFISDQPWGTPFRNSIQRQQEKYDREGGGGQPRKSRNKAVPAPIRLSGAGARRR